MKNMWRFFLLSAVLFSFSHPAAKVFVAECPPEVTSVKEAKFEDGLGADLFNAVVLTQFSLDLFVRKACDVLIGGGSGSHRSPSIYILLLPIPPPTGELNAQHVV